jgi:hypothetical protein
MKDLNYKELSALAKEKGVNPVGKSTQELIKILSVKNEESTEIKFKNKKGEVVSATYVRDYLYPKTQEVFLVASINGKKRLIRKSQLCN